MQLGEFGDEYTPMKPSPQPMSQRYPHLQKCPPALFLSFFLLFCIVIRALNIQSTLLAKYFKYTCWIINYGLYALTLNVF